MTIDATKTAIHTPSQLPGVCRIFSLPCECAQRVREVYRAQSLGDNEGVFENSLRIIELPFDMTSSLFNGLDLLFKGMLYFGFATNSPVLKTVSKVIPTFGLVVGGFETFFALRSFKHAWDILKLLKMAPEEALDQLKMQYCKTPQLVHNITEFVKKTCASPEEQERTIDNYIQQANAARARRLERRVGREAANRFYEAVNALGGELDPREILKDIHTQVKKQLILHALALIAALVSIAGIITMLCGCPLFIPLILVSISSVLTVVHGVLAAGMLPCKGWKFNVSNLFPECLRRRLFTPNDAASPSLQGRARRVPVD